MKKDKKTKNWKQKNMFFGRKDFGKLFKLGLGELSRSMEQYTPLFLKPF